MTASFKHDFDSRFFPFTTVIFSCLQWIRVQKQWQEEYKQVLRNRCINAAWTADPNYHASDHSLKFLLKLSKETRWLRWLGSRQLGKTSGMIEREYERVICGCWSSRRRRCCCFFRVFPALNSAWPRNRRRTLVRIFNCGWAAGRWDSVALDSDWASHPCQKAVKVLETRQGPAVEPWLWNVPPPLCDSLTDPSINVWQILETWDAIK